MGLASKVREIGVRHDRHHLDIAPELHESWIDAMVHAVSECDERFDEDLDGAWRDVLRPGVDLIASVY